MPEGIVTKPVNGTPERKPRSTAGKQRKQEAQRKMADRTAVETVIELMDQSNGEYPQSDVNVIKTVLADMSQKLATEIVEILTQK
ncbi:MAG: hypothetical protein WC942_08790 [Clostridia bacterium]|jgi:hypothetical protein